MPQFVPIEELFKGRHFDREIVILCVRWYLSFKLSYRDLVTMMGERGIAMAHTTISAVGPALLSRIRETLEAVRPFGGRIVAHGRNLHPSKG